MKNLLKVMLSLVIVSASCNALADDPAPAPAAAPAAITPDSATKGINSTMKIDCPGCFD